MPSRTLTVQIIGDPASASRAFKKTGDDAKRMGDRLDREGKRVHGFATLSSSGFSKIGIAARGMGVAAIAGAGGVTFLTKQFVESNKVSKQTEAVLKSTGHAAGVTSKQVSDLATAISRKTGVDDEAVQSGENLLLTFTKIRNETGKGNQIFTRATRVITDMSVALGQDMKSSAIQVGKALNDPIKGVTALQRVGVSFTAKQKEQIASLVETGHALDAQKLILRELNREFGGSAAAQATPFDKLKVSAGNLAETLGGALAPSLGKGASALNRFLNQMQDGKGAGGDFMRVLMNVANTLKGAWQSAVTAVRRVLSRHREDLQSIGQSMRSLGRTAKGVWEDVILPAVRTVGKRIGPIIDNMVGALTGLLRFISSVFAGRWGDAWDALKDTVKNAVQGVARQLRMQAEVFAGIAVNLGGRITSGIIKGLGSLGHAIFERVKDALEYAAKRTASFLDKANPFSLPGKIAHAFGDGLGKKIGDGMGTLPSGGAFGGSLMGARDSLRPFAAIGSRFGLHVSSGRRPGSITSSGNVSYHSSGEAIDLADGRGPDANKLAFFKTMRSRFGSRLAELIYTPGGVGIKDGRPYRYGGQVAADHYDHVHVAFDTGRPGVGDGLGKFQATAYGPPWDAMNGSGVTSTGVNLRNAQHAYGIAVDPSVIPLGTRVKAWPNPFHYRGYFTAFDTGGAIKGRHIDFYDWRGRAAQMRWGSRSVTLSTAGRASRKRNVHGGKVVGSSGGTTGGLSWNMTQQGQQDYRDSIAIGDGSTPDVGGDTGGGEPGPTALDFLDAQLAKAEGTPDKADDLYYLRLIKGEREKGLAAARATNDPRLVAQAQRDLNSVIDAINNLTGAVDATSDLVAALKDVKAELKRQNDFADSVAGITSREAVKFMADVLSGGVYGPLRQRRGTVGNGTVAVMPRG